MELKVWVLVASLSFASQVTAQALSEAAIATIVQNATSKVSSAENFDAISEGEKLDYAFRGIVLRSSSESGPVVSDRDLELLLDGTKQLNYATGAIQMLEATCESSISQDVRAAARAMADADSIETEDRDAYLKAVYSQLSAEGKNRVQEIIKSVEGTRAITVIRVDYEAIAIAAPNYAATAFDRTCSNLDRIYEMKMNPANPGTVMPIIGDQQ